MWSSSGAAALLVAPLASTRRAPPPAHFSPRPTSRNNAPAISFLGARAPPSSCSALDCRHFQSCSGCTHEWGLDRPPTLEDVVNFFKAHGINDFAFDPGKLWEWRCRAKLAVRGASNSPLIGLYQEGTHVVADIPHCRAHHPSINATVELLKQGISALQIKPFDEDSGVGELRYVQMAVTTYNTSIPQADRYNKGKVQVSLVWNSRDEHSFNSEKLKALSDFMWKRGGPNSTVHLVHSVWANFQTSTSNIIFGNKWRHIQGEKDFWERFGGIDVCLDPFSFGQANTQAFNSLLWKLQKHVPRYSSVVDLYSGVGIIGLSVAARRKCRSVKCVEINKESKTSFEKSSKRLPRDLGCSITWHNTDASIEPIHWLEGTDVVIVDPPRKGLDPSLVDALQKVAFSEQKTLAPQNNAVKKTEEKRPWVLRAREATASVDNGISSGNKSTWPSTLIYVSCGWESFKEDCKKLLSRRAWQLEKAYAFNFFPGTDSIEVLAVFKRGSSSVLKKKQTGKKRAAK